MISPTTHKHEKHAKLTRPSYGEWGRNELAIIGTTCDDVKVLSEAIITRLSSFKITFVDADHKNKTSEHSSEPANNNIDEEAFIEYRNKLSFTQLNFKAEPNAFQKRALLHDCDLILVNGNHFTASNQILVIDERKPLEKKLEKLSNVQVVLRKDQSIGIPGYLSHHIPTIHQLPQFSFNNTEAIARHIKQYLQQQTPVINGLVLSGGKSTRMGTDKGNLHYYDKSQRNHVFDMLSPHCHETYISCNAVQSAAITNTPKIEDAFLNLGPLSGILSAFQHNPNAAWLTVACDLPFLNEETISHLIRHRNPSKMATAYRDAEGKLPEPLVTIWEPKAYPVLLQFLAQGYSCPRKALINSDAEILNPPDAFAFKNVNTTEEYGEALSMLHKQHNS